MFSGSQKQLSAVTVFGTLETIVAQLLTCDVLLVPVGRTDAGVHAEMSICHFDIPFQIDVDRVCLSIRRKSIEFGIDIHSLLLVDSTFHALSSADTRQYDYFFAFERLPNYLLHSVACLHWQPQFFPTESELSQLLIGSRNFFSLCNSSASTKSYIRHIESIQFNERKYDSLFDQSVPIYRFSIVSHGFLYKMVRHIIGITLHSMRNFTNMSRLFDYFMVNRPLKYDLAPVQGLHLSRVDYNN